MKRVLCLVDRYFPESSANTHCADIIMEKFRKEGYIVDFMSIKFDPSLPTIERLQNGNIYKIENYLTENLRKYGLFFKAKEWKEMPWLFRKVTGALNKLIIPFRANTESPYLDTINYRNIYNMLKKELVTYEAVISFSSPFALHIIANKIKTNGLAKKWFPIFLDPFVYNYCLRKDRIESRKKTAQKFLKKADRVFMVRGIVEENIKRGYEPGYHNILDLTELPNLKEVSIEFKNNQKLSADILLTYAGSFYKDIRNPSKMLDILSALPAHFKTILIGYCCEDIIEEKSKKFKGNFEFLGRLQYTQTMEHLSKSNILINLGNTITNQTPSKVFEYISFGKPVINFYFSEDDTSLYYFKKYPLALNINLNDYKEDTIEQIISFCETHKDTKFNFEEAIRNLKDSRSENVVNRIYKTIVSHL